MRPTATTASLEVRGVTKGFDGHDVLRGVDLTVGAGRTVALLGPSGCGKTTLLRTVAGLESVDSGTIALGGSTLSGEGRHVSPERRRVGMVFQDWALFPHLDIASNVAYGLTRQERASRRVEDALEMVGLGGFGRRMPHTLSGGQQQRVALARAIAPRPAAILLDEPFSNLDAALRAQVRADTHRLLHQIGMTTLFVTHDQEEAFVVGDEVAIMHAGTILQQADPATIYARPASPWVATFVGDANLFDVDVVGERAHSSVGALDLPGVADGHYRVMVRPEELVLEPGSAGKVSLVEFYGHDTIYRVAVDGGEVIVRAMSYPRFELGDSVTIAHAGGPPRVFPPSVDLTAVSA